MGNVATVGTDSWDDEVTNVKGLVMVDFWAIWCGPCQMVAPIVGELADEYDGRLKVLKLNTDDNPEIATKFQVMSIPSLIFFKDGRQIDKIVGAQSKQKFKETIDRLLV